MLSCSQKNVQDKKRYLKRIKNHYSKNSQSRLSYLSHSEADVALLQFSSILLRSMSFGIVARRRLRHHLLVVLVLCDLLVVAPGVLKENGKTHMVSRFLNPTGRERKDKIDVGRTSYSERQGGCNEMRKMCIISVGGGTRKKEPPV